MEAASSPGFSSSSFSPLDGLGEGVPPSTPQPLPKTSPVSVTSCMVAPRLTFTFDLLFLTFIPAFSSTLRGLSDLLGLLLVGDSIVSGGGRSVMQALSSLVGCTATCTSWSCRGLPLNPGFLTMGGTTASVGRGPPNGDSLSPLGEDTPRGVRARINFASSSIFLFTS